VQGPDGGGHCDASWGGGTGGCEESQGFPRRIRSLRTGTGRKKEKKNNKGNERYAIHKNWTPYTEPPVETKRCHRVHPTKQGVQPNRPVWSAIMSCQKTQPALSLTLKEKKNKTKNANSNRKEKKVQGKKKTQYPVQQIRPGIK